jgi:hypothetical protein
MSCSSPYTTNGVKVNDKTHSVVVEVDGVRRVLSSVEIFGSGKNKNKDKSDKPTVAGLTETTAVTIVPKQYLEDFLAGKVTPQVEQFLVPATLDPTCVRGAKGRRKLDVDNLEEYTAAELLVHVQAEGLSTDERFAVSSAIFDTKRSWGDIPEETSAFYGALYGGLLEQHHPSMDAVVLGGIINGAIFDKEDLTRLIKKHPRLVALPSELPMLGKLNHGSERIPGEHDYVRNARQQAAVMAEHCPNLRKKLQHNEPFKDRASWNRGIVDPKTGEINPELLTYAKSLYVTVSDVVSGN